ncbi:phosphoribosylglycinamide formyltransferase [Salinisphaera hydrothermalis]|uniref:Phosphoribosylglycinamide formyltransferase n=1 Tax=Salinisphaera hydrothermalis (strain C41B8) TaxID=1304275 RepID=A0A084IQW0_SALHC|nr:phosphoribosylglycinamide formyltransferase [Salinisphaera hydrothermalis]KEZ79094.1 phosphoribosylglycinamide formyltransferase [Salinisphaera hydrothermalis C41B8]
MTDIERTRPARLVVLISGRGRNLEAIMRAIDAGELDAEIVLVASNKPNARGLQTARLAGLPTVAISPREFADRESYDAALARRIAADNPDWVVLAGFMRVLSDSFVERFAGRIVNIHPSLLPKYKGLHTHDRALDAGDRDHGASVHFVTPTLDDGPVIRQGRITIRDGDTADTLADRIMDRIEQRLYAAALDDLISGRVVWRDDGVYRDGQRQSTPLIVDYDEDAPSP